MRPWLVNSSMDVKHLIMIVTAIVLVVSMSLLSPGARYSCSTPEVLGHMMSQRIREAP